MSTGVLYLLDVQRLVDKDGVVSGGQIFFYYSGTSILAPIWTDEAMTIPAANPVITDASGAIPDVYLNTTISYRRYIVYPDGSTDNADPYTVQGVALPVGVTAVNLSNVIVPSRYDIIQTSGYSVVGRGVATYTTSADQTSAVGPGRLQDGSGRYFDLQIAPAGVTPEQFGAAGDCIHSPSANTTTGTPDDQAFLDMISFCVKRGNNRAWPVSLPNNYLITQNNIFGKWTVPANFIRGWKIRGSGFGTSSITFRPTGSDGVTNYYLRDGLAASGSASVVGTLLSWQWSDITLYTDNSLLTTQTVNYFRQSGWSVDSNPEQGWVFSCVNFSADTGSTARIAMNGSVLDIVGNANGSENTFDACRSLCAKHVINCSNTQAVNHKSSFCHWEVMQGDAFVFTLGGALIVTGGSIILDNTGQITAWTTGATITVGTVRYYDGVKYTASTAGTTGSTPPTHLTGTVSDGGVSWTFNANESMYLVAVGGTGTGQSNPVTMIGVRFEGRSCRAKIVRGGDGVTAELNTSSKINFYGCDFTAINGGFRTTIKLPEGGISVNFHDCNLSAVFGWQPIVVAFGAAATSIYVVSALNCPKVNLYNCLVSGQVHSYVTWGQYSTGRFAIRGSYGNPTPVGGGDLTASPDILMDCDMFNPAQAGFGNKGSGGGALKAVAINFHVLPGGDPASVNPDGSHSAFTLPPGAYFQSIRVSHPAGGGNNVTAQYVVKGVSSGTTYGTLPAVASVSAGFNVTTDIGAFVQPTDRTFRLVDTTTHNPGSITRQLGDAIIVYYI